MTVLLWALGLLAGGLAVAALRQPLEGALRAALGVPEAVLEAVSAGLGRVVEQLARGAAHAWDALSYGREGTTTTIWDVVAPVVYSALFLVLLAGDLVLASLRFAALLGVEIVELPVSSSTLDILAGVLFIAVLATMGATWLDVNRVTPLRRPYGLLDGPMRTAIGAIAVSGTALSAVAGLLFLVWGQGALDGAPSTDLATLFVAVFGVLLVTASVLALGGAIPIVPVAALGVLLAAGVVLALFQWMFDVVLALLAAIGRLAIQLLAVLARPGELLWSWLAGRPAGRRLGIEPTASCTAGSATLPETVPTTLLSPPRTGAMPSP